MNEAIFYFFYSLAHVNPYQDKLIIFLAVYLPYIVVLGAAAFLLFHRRSPREFAVVFFSSIFAWVVSKALKIFMQMARPFDALQNVQSLFTKSDYAFPSGHATFFAALAVALFFYHKKMGYLFMFFALVIGLARIAAGVHSPEDILGGFLLGGVIGYLLHRIIK